MRVVVITEAWEGMDENDAIDCVIRVVQDMDAARRFLNLARREQAEMNGVPTSDVEEIAEYNDYIELTLDEQTFVAKWHEVYE